MDLFFSKKGTEITLRSGKNIISHITYTIYPEKKEIFLGELHTKQRFRKKGYASLLMSHFLKEIKQYGGYSIRLICRPFYHYRFDKRDGNLIGLNDLIAFYEKYGFVIDVKDKRMADMSKKLI